MKKLKFVGQYTHGRTSITMNGVTFDGHKPTPVPDHLYDELSKGEFAPAGEKFEPNDEPEEADEPETLTGKNKSELMKIAKDEEVEIKGGSTNKQIVKAIEKARGDRALEQSGGMSQAEAQGYTVEGRSKELAEPEVSQAEAQGYTVEDSPEPAA